jgi:DNA-binding Lrp family transcriptional regulator
MEKIRVFSFVQLEHQKLEYILYQFNELPQIKSYSVVTGEFDGVVEVEVDSMDELYETFNKIDGIEGIKNYTSHIVVKRFDLTIKGQKFGKE